MNILRQNALRGMNVWTHRCAIQVLLRLEQTENTIENSQKLVKQLQRHWPTFALKSSSDLASCSLAHVIALLALELQIQAACSIGYCHVNSTFDPCIFKLVVEYSEEAVGHLAVHQAILLCQSILSDRPYQLEAVIAELYELNEDIRMGPSTASIVQAALARGIPYQRLTDGSLIQFGWGCKQRRIRGSEINSTRTIAEEIAQDKELTRTLLTASAIPTPIGRVVRSVEQAWQAACEIGLPVVLKPRSGNHGRGVTVNITSQQALHEAFDYASKIEDDILVEQYIKGHDYRLLVVGRELVAAARRSPPMLVGDGQHTIAELIDILNQDPRRGQGHSMPLSRVLVDALVLENLASLGLNMDSCLALGQEIVLRHNANLSSGGSATDVTDEIHPDFVSLAVDASIAIGLSPCGIDLICEDIRKPLHTQKAAIIEMNASPGLRMHLFPSEGQARPVGEAIIRKVFDETNNGRIPLVAVTGTNGKTTTVRLITHILKQSGFCVGMTNSDGVYINGQLIDDGDCSGPKSARKVLAHPDVDAAVFETARGGILREGLGFDASQVAVVTNLGRGDHLGIDYIETLDELALIKRTVVSSVTEQGWAVLNAADPVVADMALHCRGQIIFFAADKNIAQMRAHYEQGGRIVYIEHNYLVASVSSFSHRIALKDAPLTLNGTIGFQIENMMASVAAAWALEAPWVDIVAAVQSFTSEPHHTPGRFNLFNYRDARVIVDYGHNPDAMYALSQAIETMPAKKRVLVISGAGDRQDQAIKNMTEILGDIFDTVLLYQDQCQRGRSDGEVLELLHQGLSHAKRARHIEKIYGELSAIDRALSYLDAGDLCLILADQVELSIQHIVAQINALALID